MQLFEVSDRRMHAISAIVSLTVAAALAVYVIRKTAPTTCEGADCAPDKPDMREELVEASLAFKAETPPPPQPQKQFREKEKQIDPDGVAKTDQEIVKQKTCKVDRDCDDVEECIKGTCVRRKNKRDAETDPLAKIPDRTNIDDDAPTSPTTTPQVGAFDGSKYGRGPVNKGDPYFAKLKTEVEGYFDEGVDKLTTGEPAEGCIHMTADGVIKDTKMRKQAADRVTEAAKQAVERLKDARNKKPEPVPDHLLGVMTTQWTCFNFTATDAD